jgi:AcrR family transcriptional regulator
MSDVESVDPRVTRTREVVIAAVAELLAEEGPSAITHQRVAERAGVGRATLYRHWPQPLDLLFDTLAEVDEPFLHHGDGPLRPWLLRELRRAAEAMDHPVSAQLVSVLISNLAIDGGVGAFRDRLLDKSIAPLAEAIERASASGELTTVPDPVELFSVLIGPIMLRRFVQGLAVPRSFIERLVDRQLAPYVAQDSKRARVSR